MESRMGLSSPEWRDAIKLQENLPPIRALHGRSQYNSLCRHCNERKILHHGLGFCHYAELLRNNRHHLISSKITAVVKVNNNHHLEVYKEVHCVVSNGSNRRVDIFAIDRSKKLGFIWTPLYDLRRTDEQPFDFDMEKKKFLNILLATLKIYII